MLLLESQTVLLDMQVPEIESYIKGTLTILHTTVLNLKNKNTGLIPSVALVRAFLGRKDP